MITLIILLVIAFVIFSFIRFSRAEDKKYEEDKKIARIDTIDTYERIKKAIAINGDVEHVNGFEIFENSNWIRNHTVYPELIKPMCVELVRNGYDFGQFISDTYYGFWVHEEEGKYEARITIAKEKEEQGSIQLYCPDRYINFSHYHSMQHYKNYYWSKKGGSKTELHHMIMNDDLLMCLESKGSLFSPTPEWLIICAKVIKDRVSEFKDPEWVRESPEAKEYVNSMF